MIVWLFYLDSAHGEYRYKLRGPQQLPQRAPTPPPSHQIKKKWHMPHAQPPPPGPGGPRIGVRKRPVPIMNNINFKSNIKVPLPLINKRPMMSPQVTPPVNIPLRNIWKHNNNVNIFKKPEKPFLSSPTVKTPEYEYHIHTNNIPTSPIKQIDYKGPIHTIPAPKLSPADKPKNIETVKPVERETIVQIQKAHQYQVTESSDSMGVFSNKYQNKQQYYFPEIESFNTQESGLKNQPSSSLSTQELFKLFNNYNQQQPFSESTYTLPLTQQPQMHVLNQNTPLPYQTLVSQPGLFQPEIGFASQLQHTPNHNFNKPQFQPEYQTFNYEEPVSNNNKQNDDQSIASSSDFIETSLEPNSNNNRNPVEALAQSQYVQRFFDTRTDDVNNNVEPDARPPIKHYEPETNNEEIISGAYYTILPNQKAAESLASLQEAGKKNTNIIASTTQTQSIQVSPSIPMTIYVPDDYEDTEPISQEKQRYGEKNGKENLQENESKDDETLKTENARSKNRGSFGSRTKPKKI